LRVYMSSHGRTDTRKRSKTKYKPGEAWRKTNSRFFEPRRDKPVLPFWREK